MQVDAKLSVPTLPKTQKRLLIMDWDDTLLAATELSRCASVLALRVSAETSKQQDLAGFVAQNLNAEQKSAWSAVDDQLVAFIMECAKYADNLDVLLVTNAKPQWIEHTTAKLLPATAKAIAQTFGWKRVVSARGNREITPYLTHQHLVFWKQLVFQEWLRDRPYAHIICIGDSPVEHEALQRSVDNSSNENVMITFVWLPAHPCMCALSRQLVAMRKSLAFLLTADPTQPIRHIRLAPQSAARASANNHYAPSTQQSLGPSAFIPLK